MIRTFHEAPVSLFNRVQELTDGDYALVNLFKDNEAYYQLFVEAVKAGREVILDNGVFELGKAWSADEYAGWIDNLKPTYYIVPDVLNDGKATVESFFNFINNHKNLPGKILGVAQGRNYQDYVECYKTIEPYCDKIGISFDCPWYGSDFYHRNAWARLAIGRSRTLAKMDAQGIINRSKPHHLLGVSLPQEVLLYATVHWIDSVDTSNPVVHGLKGIEYGTWGLDNKETQKLYTLVNATVDVAQLKAIEFNIRKFRGFCHGNLV